MTAAPDREEQDAVIEPAGDDAGYAHAVTAHLTPTHCSICGRGLIDADSVQRGYGPICAEKYMRPMRATGPLSETLLSKAFEMAPERLKKRLLAVADRRDWADPDVRHKLVNVAVFHASIATSYGDSAKSIQENGIDVSHVVVAAVQTLARGAGYDQLAERLITAHAKENQQRRQGRETDEGYGKGEADITIEFTDASQKMMRLATPYSEAFNAAARKSQGLFPKFEKVGRVFWRMFKTEDINKVVNLVTSVFGDVIALGPDRTLAPLPAMPMFIVPPKTPTPPPPKSETGPEPVVVPPAVQEIKVGDIVELPDGRQLSVSWTGVTKAGAKRIAVGPKGQYEFLGFSDVKYISAGQATQVLKTEAAEAAKDARQQGVSAPVPPTKVERAVPAECFPYQIDIVRWLDDKGSGLLAAEQGTGKTLMSIAALDAPALVVCDAKMKLNWVKEILRWRSELTAQVIDGTKPVAASELKAPVVVINYDVLHAHLDALLARKWATVVFDEAQALKNLDVRWDKEKRVMVPDGPRRAVAAYRVVQQAERVFLLTGTPIMNRVRELWPLLHLVNPQKWSSFFKFGVRFCAGHQVNIGRGRLVWDFNGRSNTDELHKMISGQEMYRVLKVDVLKDLPEMSRQTVAVQLDEKSAKVYKQAADKFLQWVLERGGPEAMLLAERAEALTRLTALRRLAAAGKVDVAEDWVRRFNDSTGRPLVVFGWHTEPLQELKRRLLQPQDDFLGLRVEILVGGTSQAATEDIKERFQAGQVDVLIMAIPLAKGHTLTAASDELFLERAWRPADLAQAEARCHRIGAKNAVLATYLDAEGTIDEALGELLAEKAKTAAGVIDGVNLEEDDAVAQVVASIFGVRQGRKSNSPQRRTRDVRPAYSWNDPL